MRFPPAGAGAGSPEETVIVDALELPGGVRLELAVHVQGWNLVLRSKGGTGADDDPAGATTAGRWLVDQLAGGEPVRDPAGGPASSSGPASGFRVERFLPLAAPPTGERLIGVDQTNRSVIVGEEVVVKWLRRIDDADHPALTALAHLAEVRFAGTPATFGALTWQTPGDRGSTSRRVPLGFATALLPGALDGWDWCPPAFSSADRDFPAAIGRLTAQLHVAFATPSSILPAPTALGGDELVRRWHARARERLADVVQRIGELDDAGAGPEDDRPLHRPSEVIADRRAAMETVLAELLDVQGPTPLQRIHGDLHVGQVLRWPGGLAVIDFDGNPIPDAVAQNPADPPGAFGPAGMASTARDVAQLMISLDQVGRIIDRQSGHTRTGEVDAWSRWARAEFSAGYLAELAELGRSDVFDVRLLRPFLVEQASRDLLYSLRFLPRWAYATIDGLALLLSEDVSAT